METTPTYTHSTGPIENKEPENQKFPLTQKQIGTLLIIGYAGIVISYGILLYVKLKHSK
jgi:hypothetical protein